MQLFDLSELIGQSKTSQRKKALKQNKRQFVIGNGVTLVEKVAQTSNNNDWSDGCLFANSVHDLQKVVNVVTS